MTVSHLCRVTVQTDCKDRSFATDLALPSGIELGALLPSVVDIVGGDFGIDVIMQRWILSRLDGSMLDESKTLHENGVCDGDVLMLTTSNIRTPAGDARDLCHAVVNASGSSHDGQLARRMSASACLWAAGIGAISLVSSSDHDSAYSRAAIAAMVATAAIAGSIVADRIALEPLPTLAFGVTASAFAAVAGFLAVPGGPAPPNFVLSAVICAAVSIVLIHTVSPGAPYFAAIAAFSTTVAITAAAVTIWPAPIATVGAMLITASLALLGAATKLSIVMTGLSPAIPGVADDAAGDVTAGGGVARGENGHRTLTGLLTGFSATAATGAALVAADHQSAGALSRIGLTAVVAAVLLLRARHQLGVFRPVAMYAAGMISATATFIMSITAVPHQAQWVCLTAAVLGVGVLWLTVANPFTRPSPLIRRSVELVEYLALGLVVPMACWVGDVFGLVRGLSLP
jgi:type VII secretion integral membrane protein EccD